jgi:hypothetical protein
MIIAFHDAFFTLGCFLNPSIDDFFFGFMGNATIPLVLSKNVPPMLQLSKYRYYVFDVIKYDSKEANRHIIVLEECRDYANKWVSTSKQGSVGRLIRISRTSRIN